MKQQTLFDKLFGKKQPRYTPISRMMKPPKQTKQSHQPQERIKPDLFITHCDSHMKRYELYSLKSDLLDFVNEDNINDARTYFKSKFPLGVYIIVIGDTGYLL